MASVKNNRVGFQATKSPILLFRQSLFRCLSRVLLHYLTLKEVIIVETNMSSCAPARWGEFTLDEDQGA